ncbi:hypothetical protein JCM11251_004472 [Rhodosporidiobolus azoricus]
MHCFISNGFEPLHAHVVDLLAEDGVHSLLPLLGVNREWRRLAVKRMLKAYERTYETMKGRSKGAWLPEKQDGEFILCLPCRICWMDAPYKETDPRMIWPAVEVEHGFDALPLFLTTFDAATTTCTFEPNNYIQDLSFDISCNEDHVDYAETPPCFELHSSAWLRPASPTSITSLNGLELAARPENHPPIGVHCFFPSIPYEHHAKSDGSEIDELDKVIGYETASVVVNDKPLHLGDNWMISYRAARFDSGSEVDPAGLGICVPAVLSVERLRVPFIDLFAPQWSCKEPAYYEM